ncbi:3-dehydroquinate synthase [Neorhodopirellula pilleata]|uniref:3-dehydroquinate synthase n=1 Tax=Neorhodopirellula pilleata TaxID=2714738 RepID=A0A5C6AGK2_9BACT|nr:3-dehydroquinate synthase [Neorhodopirellula pilleata]TWT97343.1 3-dehydroquinate synthase [Neorhodopirellula pilleata]
MPLTDPTIIPVELGDRRYPIVIGSGTAVEAGDASGGTLGEHLLGSLGDVSHAVMVYDAAVKDSAAASVQKTLQARVGRVDALEVASGETSKSIDNLGRLWNRLIEVNADRRSVIVAVGGGVVGDLAGFVAATYTRGLRFVQVPTTLLAMVDSSVGGKTGINLPGGKNMVGSFWQPHLVWIDTDFMATLPDREYLSGLAEVIKYGVIEDAEFFAYLEDNMQAIVARDPQSVRHAIACSCQSKARVVADDERETSGRRAILNYGHTFAHAIEATAGYGTMLHGEAVAIGMQMAARLAVALGKCEADLINRQTRLLDNAQLPLVWPQANPEAMIPVMARDKKVAHGKLRFVLPDRIGHVELVGDVPVDQVRFAIDACQ